MLPSLIIFSWESEILSLKNHLNNCKNSTQMYKCKTVNDMEVKIINNIVLCRDIFIHFPAKQEIKYKTVFPFSLHT